MTRSAPLFPLVVLALTIGCKSTPEARPTETDESQAYSTVPTQEELQTAADEDAARLEQEAAEAAAKAAKPEKPALSDADKRFIDVAANAGMAEVELSKVALDKIKKPGIKSFAQKMIDDHGKANAELQTFCSNRGITLPTELDENNQKRRAELEKKTGTKLEKAYVNMMLEDHREAVELFRTQSQSGSDPELKQWAGKTLPTLEEHLAHVEALAAGKPYKPKAASQASTMSPPPSESSSKASPPPSK